MANDVGLSNGDYIAQTDKKLREFKASDKSRKRRLLLFSLAVVVLSSVMVYYSYYRGIQKSELLYSQYTSVAIDTVDIELFQYKDTYLYFEARHLGNSNTNLLLGGYFLEKDGFIVCPNSDVTDTYIAVNGERSSLCGELCSYVNLFENKVYFRKNSDRNIYRKDMKNGEVTLLLEGNIGQFSVKDASAFYIDYADNNSLYTVSLLDSSSKKLFEKPIASFIVLGDYAICLTDERELYLVNASDGANEKIHEYIEAFFFNGQFVVQNNGAIFQLGLTTQNPQEVSPDKIFEATLIAADKEVIYFQKEKSLFALNLDSGQINELCSGYDIYNAVFVDKTQTRIIATSINKATNVISKKSFAVGGIENEQ